MRGARTGAEAAGHSGGATTLYISTQEALVAVTLATHRREGQGRGPMGGGGREQATTPGTRGAAKSKGSTQRTLPHLLQQVHKVPTGRVIGGTGGLGR